VSRFFIQLYLDEDVSVLIAQLLRARGHSALTAQEAGQLGRSDAEQLDFAQQRQLALLTHNRDDFAQLGNEYLNAGKTHCGIIIAVRRSPYDLTGRLLTLMDRVSAEEMDNQVLYI
jgi:predicted nuclease of predicted toxin-antitoxin system